MCTRQDGIQPLHDLLVADFIMTINNEFEELSKGALLEVLLPATGAFDAVTILQAGKTEEIKSAALRKHLFLGACRVYHAEDI